MPEKKEVDPERFELIERRLTETITGKVHSQVFRWYISLGVAIAAVLGFLGWDILGRTREEIVEGFDQTRDELVQSIQTTIIKPYAEIASALNVKMRIASELHDRAIRSLDKLDDEIAEARPKMLSVGDMAQKVDDLGTRARDLEALVQQLHNSTTHLLEAAAKVSSLGAEVNKLADAVHSFQPTADVAAISTSAKAIVTELDAITQQILTAKESPTVYFLHSSMPPDTADKIGAALMEAGFVVPASDSERMPASGLSEVRYYYDADRPQAAVLVDAANRIIQNMGIAAAPVTLKSLTNWPAQKPRQGTLELWIGLKTTASAG